jgi:hypothetical protein
MKNLVIVFVAIVLFAGCNKELQYKTVYLDPGLKATFDYKPGTYFIFKDSITGELDSVYLVSNLSKIDEGYTTSRGFKYEYMALDFDAKNISKNDSSNLGMFLSFSSMEGNRLICGMKSGFQPLYSFFLYPAFKVFPINNTDTITFISSNNQLRLNNHDFKNLYIFIQSPKGNQARQSTGYWSNEMGLVKMRFLSETSGVAVVKVLELQRWYIIK